MSYISGWREWVLLILGARVVAVPCNSRQSLFILSLCCSIFFMFTEFSRGGEKLWVSVCAIMRQVLITFCLQMTRCYSSKMEVGVQSICKIFYLCVRIAQGRP